MSAMKSNMLSLAFWAHHPFQESSFSNGCHSDPFHEPTKQASWLMLVKGSIECVSKTLSPWCMLAQSTHFHKAKKKVKFFQSCVVMYMPRCVTCMYI